MNNLILTQEIPIDVFQQQMTTKARIHSTNHRLSKEQTQSVRAKLSSYQQKPYDISTKKGVSSWLTVLPIRAQGFDLHKGAFKDCLCLRYGWTPSSLSTSCTCGSPFLLIMPSTALLVVFPPSDMMVSETYSQTYERSVNMYVSVEPTLQPLTGENLIPISANSSTEARLDIRADGFWECDRQSAFFRSTNFQPDSTRQS